MKTKNSSLHSGGVLEVLRIALPLVLSASGHALNLFTDRVMLTHYSTDTMAAAFPAGLTAFAFSCFFVGTVGYTGAFVAQYVGAKMTQRVGIAVWQGIILAIIGGVFMAVSSFAAPQIFEFFGHEQHIKEMEIIYYKILSCGTVIPLLSGAFACFWGGRGKTIMIMIVNFLIAGCNIPFNYILIFGTNIPLPYGGSLEVPSLGIAGAAYGTLAAGFIGLLVYMVSFWSPANVRNYGTFYSFFDFNLFCRMIRFGAPNGIQMFLDLTTFNLFVIIIGKISSVALTASGVAFALNALAFIPMIGIGQTASILVGQSIGAGDIAHAERSVRSARILILIYMGFMAIMFVIYPDPVLKLFALNAGEVMSTVRIMLRFMAAWLLFDGLALLYGNAIKGAGDTKFAMWLGVTLAWLLYAMPCVAIFMMFQKDSVRAHFGKDANSWCLWSMWTTSVVYIVILGTVFYLRYRAGHWKKMSVIENCN